MENYEDRLLGRMRVYRVFVISGVLLAMVSLGAWILARPAAAFVLIGCVVGYAVVVFGSVVGTLDLELTARRHGEEGLRWLKLAFPAMILAVVGYLLYTEVSAALL